MQHKLEQQYWILLFGCVHYYGLDIGHFACCPALENPDEAEGQATCYLHA